jgi:organic hydroperoxide reductase OsmC/OhrA
MNDEHAYTARVVWEGNTGEGTARYAGYGREYRVVIAGKPDLAGSADAAFRGDAGLHNPEDLFLSSISACHMLFYLALCAREGVRVTAYEDEARGVMRVRADGGGRFESVTLHPRVTLADAEHVGMAERLHERAHALCFIANSCGFPIRHEATVRVGGFDAADGAAAASTPSVGNAR